VFGTSLGRLWRDYEASIRTPPADDGVDVGLRRLTHHDYIVRGPRFDPFVCHRCAASVVYAVRSPHGFPALSRVGLDGSAPRRMATRYLGSTSAVGRQEIFFDQQELRRNTGLYSDLYAWSRANGRVRRITREARLLDPDLAPGGDVLAAVRDRPGERDLVLVRLAPRTTIGIETLIAEPETQFSTPRWSPDGRSIAVERHRLGALPEIVLVEVATRSVRTIAAIAGARVVTPAWHPDGQAIVAAVAPRDTPFNLYEFPIDGGAAARQLTHTTGGATWPDVSPDGNTIVFVGYTPEGFDLFALPYPVSSPNRMAAGAGPPVDRAPQRAAAHSGDAVASADVTSSQTDTRLAAYSPLKTIRPTSWTPIIESDNTQVRIGAATGGVDVLAYHAYAASATWLVARPAGAPAPRAATPDWRAYYAYDRWRPTLWVSASAATSFFSGPATDAGTPASAALRERAIEAGLLLPIRHVRTSHAALFSMRAAADDYTLPDRTISRDTRAVRAAWSFLSARTYGYSVSREDGVAVGATAESVSRALGSFAGATAFTADLRAYLPGAAAHHVIALRAAGGVAAGDSDVQRTFHLGGAAGNPGVIDFGRDAASLLRGFGSDTFAGSHVAVVNADYRFPIARPQRGAGTWPVMLHTVHGALFADAGHAWTRTFRAQAIKTCVGAELSADVVAGYLARVTLTAGVARGHDGSGTIPDRTVMYARVGRAF
jgi:hypothetical protein